jgi:hypothetical protein
MSNTRDWDYTEYKIGEAFMSAVINGDYSGLHYSCQTEDNCDTRLNAFLDEVGTQFGDGHWSHDSEQEGYFDFCEVARIDSTVYDLRYNFKT